MSLCSLLMISPSIPLVPPLAFAFAAFASASSSSRVLCPVSFDTLAIARSAAFFVRMPAPGTNRLMPSRRRDSSFRPS